MTLERKKTVAGFIMIGISVILSLMGAVYMSSVSVDKRLEASTEDLRKVDSDHLSRIATLEEAISTIKKDSEQTKKDIREILNLLK